MLLIKFILVNYVIVVFSGVMVAMLDIGPKGLQVQTRPRGMDF
jgi:hypothetical protein